MRFDITRAENLELETCLQNSNKNGAQILTTKAVTATKNQQGSTKLTPPG